MYEIFYFHILACSQIWLNISVDDSQFDYITKLTQKNTAPTYVWNLEKKEKKHCEQLATHGLHHPRVMTLADDDDDDDDDDVEELVLLLSSSASSS